MISPVAKLTSLTNGMHPAVKIGLLVAAAALTWYAYKVYQRSNAPQPDPDENS
jgi:uncharacterized membrane protein YebE (DUF533 family)